MEEENQISQAQKEALEESLSRAQAFEELIRTKGWVLVKAWYQNKIQHLASALLIEDKPIIEFEAERRELMGIRSLLGYIENDLKNLQDSIENAKKARRTTKE